MRWTRDEMRDERDGGGWTDVVLSSLSSSVFCFCFGGRCWVVWRFHVVPSDGSNLPAISPHSQLSLRFGTLLCMP